MPFRLLLTLSVAASAMACVAGTASASEAAASATPLSLRVTPSKGGPGVYGFNITVSSTVSRRIYVTFAGGRVGSEKLYKALKIQAPPGVKITTQLFGEQINYKYFAQVSRGKPVVVRVLYPGSPCLYIQAMVALERGSEAVKRKEAQRTRVATILNC